MNLPVVSIVGRQNVGKSTLFNAIAKKKIAITHDFPGVTRDVIEVEVNREDFSSPFLLCDTPGLDIKGGDELTDSILEGAFRLLSGSDLILFVIDRKEITDYDYKLIKLFREDKKFRDKKILYCVNKSDKEEDDSELEFFYRMGISEFIPISATGRRNIKALYSKMDFLLSSASHSRKKEGDPLFKICITGKPNSGKSSLLNSILGYERAVVSDVPGTTRDSINTRFNYKSNIIELVDTAGLRKKNKDDSLEFYSMKRALESIETSDVVVLLIDAIKKLGEYDKKIFSEVRDRGKSLIFAVNKWDLVENKETNTLSEFKKDLIDRFHPVAEFPLITISAKERLRVSKLLDECISLYERSALKIETSKLNKAMRTFIEQGKLAGQARKKPKLLYATQVSNFPFKVLCFVNDVELFKPAVSSYLKKKIWEEFNLGGCQIEIEFRSDRNKPPKSTKGEKK